MLYIQHRVNRTEDLENLQDLNLGVEIDLRSDVANVGSIHLSHDPWSRGVDFESWLKVWVRKGFGGPLILNTKEDGLEAKALEQLKLKKVENFFFLDTTQPTLVKWTCQKNEKRFAVRLSRYEPVEFALKFVDKAEWAWIDCFDTNPLDASMLKPLHGKLKLCMVSPELQGGSETDFGRFKSIASQCDAICTKNAAAWSSLLNKPSI